MTQRVEDLEMGDATPLGKVEGWFFDARGRIVLLIKNRWRTFYRGTRVEEVK